jgi:hypothetical protein
LRDPFGVTNLQNFSGDHRTRIILLAGNLVLEDSSLITAQAQDAMGNPYPLTVEFVGKVPGYDWLSEVVVRFPDQIAYTGDFWVSISLRGVASNKAFVTIKP